MKTRQGFVSNSSSSSFIIATDGKETVKMMVEVNLDNLSEYSIQTIEGLNEFFEYEHDAKFDENSNEDSYYYTEYLACKKAIKNGKTIFAGSVGSEGNCVEQFIYENGFEENELDADIEIIESEEY